MRWRTAAGIATLATVLLAHGNAEGKDRTPKKEGSCPIGVVVWDGPDPYKDGRDAWKNTVPELRRAYRAFNKAVGREQGVISTWRPQGYSNHLVSIWDAWRFVNGKSVYVSSPSCKNYGKTLAPPSGWENCGKLRDTLKQRGGELDAHGAWGNTRPACVSHHNRGFSIDIVPPATHGQRYRSWIDKAAALSGDLSLCHPVKGDEPHFVLRKYLPKGKECVRY